MKCESCTKCKLYKKAIEEKKAKKAAYMKKYMRNYKSNTEVMKLFDGMSPERKKRIIKSITKSVKTK